MYQLYSNGEIAAPPPASDDLGSLNEVEGLFTQIANAERRELRAEGLNLNLAAAVWAGERTFRAAQALVHREHPASFIEAHVLAGYEGEVGPEVIYSVDLTFRALPDILHLARGLSHDDPLTVALLKLCHAWPLSSVGVGGMEAVCIDRVAESMSLLSFYVDRILLTGDVSRLNDARVDTQVRAALGNHPELSPRVAAALKK